jgi:hypothetical protein
MLLTKISFTVQLMQWRKHGMCQALPFFIVCADSAKPKPINSNRRAKKRRDSVHSYMPVTPCVQKTPWKFWYQSNNLPVQESSETYLSTSYEIYHLNS